MRQEEINKLLDEGKSIEVIMDRALGGFQQSGWAVTLLVFAVVIASFCLIPISREYSYPILLEAFDHKEHSLEVIISGMPPIPIGSSFKYFYGGVDGNQKIPVVLDLKGERNQRVYLKCSHCTSEEFRNFRKFYPSVNSVFVLQENSTLIGLLIDGIENFVAK